MQSQTIKVTGVPEELVALMDKRLREHHRTGRSEYIRELIRRDVLGEPRTFRDILAPIHAETERLGTTEEEIAQLVEEARNEVFVRRPRNTSHK